MNRLLVKEISACIECCHIKHNFSQRYEFCSLCEDKFIADFNKIPDWCKLEKVEKQISE